MGERKLDEQQSGTRPTATYRIDGLSCADCAKTFESNVKRLDGVDDAVLNFGAAKITVSGQTSIDELEQAGAFEGLKLRPERAPAAKSVSFWKQKTTRKVYAATVLLLLALIATVQYGETHPVTGLAYLLTVITGGYSLFSKGFRNLIRLNFDMNTLMTIAVTGAAIIGEWMEGAIVVILFAVSEALERYSMDKARQSIASLMDIAPNEALIRREGQEQLLAVEDIRVGDIMIVKPGEKLAMDGRVVAGASSINQAAITGESVPVMKDSGDDVFAGTLNEEGLLEIEVTRLVEDTTLAKIIHLVEEAQNEQAPSQQFVDRFAYFYTPAIIVLAALVMTVPPLATGAPWDTWIYLGLATLVVGCPCALVISTPVAVVTAIGNAARNGVLIKGGIHLEEAGGLKAIAFDKTGTLTKGTPAVTDVIPLDGTHQEALHLAAAVEYGSHHPLAKAIIQAAEASGFDRSAYDTAEFRSLTGQGVEARINGEHYLAGSPVLFFERGLLDNPSTRATIQALEASGKTVMVLGSPSSVIALIAVADEVRDTAKSVIRDLNRMGIDTVMLTGDNERTATAVANDAGVTRVFAGLMPEDKLTRVRELRTSHGHVAMVGDGINDAPALAASNLGVAMGGAGTDTALETADIALMADDLNKLPFTIRLSQKALSIIKQNITFALGLKALALLLVIPGWLTLWIAIIADMGATLLVTANSLRLMRMKERMKR